MFVRGCFVFISQKQENIEINKPLQCEILEAQAIKITDIVFTDVFISIVNDDFKNQEEAGIILDKSDVVTDAPLCFWESVFPQTLSRGISFY